MDNNAIMDSRIIQPRDADAVYPTPLYIDPFFPSKSKHPKDNKQPVIIQSITFSS